MLNIRIGRVGQGEGAGVHGPLSLDEERCASCCTPPEALN